MKLSPAGFLFIKQREGFEPNVYDDGVGVRTIGYGTTAADVSPLPSHITEPEAARLFAERVGHSYEPPVRALFGASGPLHGMFTQNRYDALVSFVYNLGASAVPAPPAWTPRPRFEQFGRSILSRDAQRIADVLLLYSDPGNPTVHRGLLARREAERAMFLRPDPIAFSALERRLMSRPLTPATRRLLRAQARRLQLAARAAPDGWQRHDRARRFHALRVRATSQPG